MKKFFVLTFMCLLSQAAASCTPAGLAKLYEMNKFKPTKIACLPDGPLGMMIGQNDVAYSNEKVFSGRFDYNNVSLKSLMADLTFKFGSEEAIFSEPRNDMAGYSMPLPEKMKRTFVDLPPAIRNALQLIVFASYNKYTKQSHVIFGVYVDMND